MASLTDMPALEPRPLLDGVLGSHDEAEHRASLRIRGELCAVTVVGHARQLGDLVDRGYVDLRLELDDLVLCTSDGIDLWDDLQHRLDPLAGRLTLCGATGVVRRVLEIVRAGDRHFCPSVETAA